MSNVHVIAALLAQRNAARRRNGAAILLAVVSILTYLVLRAAVRPPAVDIDTYRAEGLALRSGINLYGHIHAPGDLRATYPPFAAILFLPLTFVSAATAETLGLIANLVLVFVVAFLSCRVAGIERARVNTCAWGLGAAAIWSEPVFHTLGFGQVNLVLVALVLADFVLPSARWRGVGIGLGAGLKVTPGLLIVYLLLTGRRRTAATAFGTLLCSVVLSLAAAPRDTTAFWTKVLFDVSRVGDLANGTNQSIIGVVVRLTRDTDPSPDRPTTAIAVMVALLALACARYAYRSLGDPWGLSAAVVASLLGSPIAWTHHWVWCIPFAALLLADLPKWLPLVGVFWAWPLFLTSRRANEIVKLPTWELLNTNWYVLFGLAWIALVLRHARQVAMSPIATPSAQRERAGPR